MGKQIKSVISALFGSVAGAAVGAAVAGKKSSKKAQVQRTYAEKHLLIMRMFNQWMILKQEGKSLEKYFRDNGYQSIAIYGMSFIGRRLYEELANYVEIDYAIDKNADNICMDICIYLPNDHLEEVDELVELIVEVMMIPDNSTIRIAGVEKPAVIVKNRFMKLGKMHMEYILSCLGANTSKVGNIKSYLLTVLYNAPVTISRGMIRLMAAKGVFPAKLDTNIPSTTL